MRIESVYKFKEVEKWWKDNHERLSREFWEGIEDGSIHCISKDCAINSFIIGNWMEDELDRLGCPKEDKRDICRACGSRSFNVGYGEAIYLGIAYVELYATNGSAWRATDNQLPCKSDLIRNGTWYHRNDLVGDWLGLYNND